MNPTDPVPPEPSGTLTRADRLRLVDVQQRQALAKGLTNPLAANLGVLNGDLMRLAHLQAERLSAGAAESAGEIETFLRVVRQVDRLADRERQLDAAGEPPGSRVQRRAANCGS